MSDNWLILIPKSPDYVPPKDAQQRAIALFRTIAPEADEIGVEVSDGRRLIDCGTNLEKITCPCCQKEMNMEWWTGWASQEAELSFPLKSTPLPCCGAIRNLADLIYDWPLGFARFSIEAMNPNIRDLPPSAERDFETILGCSILKIWQHL
jgi:hypothetical protein